MSVCGAMKLKQRLFQLTLLFGLLVLTAGVSAHRSDAGDQVILHLPVVTGGLAITLDPFVVGLPEVTDLKHAGDDRLFAALRDGRVYIIEQSGILVLEPFLDIRDRVSRGYWEEGLLGIAFHPRFADNGQLYVYYTAKVTGDDIAPGVLSRFTADSATGRIDPDSEVQLLSIPHLMNLHYGGALHFGPDGYLYLASGDSVYGMPLEQRPRPPNAQNGANLLGKILRIDVDGTVPYAIPPDNPFVGEDGIRDEIWHMGLRNPWRFSFDRLTGDMVIADVGEGYREEVNIVPAGVSGLNFGWPCYEGTREGQERDDCGPIDEYVFPQHEYVHADGRCAITGGFVYRGRDYPQLSGRYLFADFCSGELWALSNNDAGSPRVSNVGTFAGNMWTTFGEDLRGELYLGQWRGDLTVYRVGAMP